MTWEEEMDAIDGLIASGRMEGAERLIQRKRSELLEAVVVKKLEWLDDRLEQVRHQPSSTDHHEDLYDWGAIGEFAYTMGLELREKGTKLEKAKGEAANRTGRKFAIPEGHPLRPRLYAKCAGIVEDLYAEQPVA